MTTPHSLSLTWRDIEALASLTCRLERILGALCLAHFRASNSEDISVEELMAATANRKKLANNARSMLYDKVLTFCLIHTQGKMYVDVCERSSSFAADAQITCHDEDARSYGLALANLTSGYQ